MLAKVQYAGPNGEVRQFDAQVPDNAPARFTSRHPDDGSPLEAELVSEDGSWQPRGGVAIYRAVVSDSL